MIELLGNAYDIVTIGEPLYEFNQQSDGRYLAGFGGDTSNVAVAAARLGSRVACITGLGGDMFGDAILSLYEREGIDTRFVKRDAQAPTGLYFVTHTDKGHEFTYRRQGSAASLLSVDDIPQEALTQTRFVHASGISQAISANAAEAVSHAFAAASLQGCRISYDTNFRPRLWSAAQARAVIGHSAAQADILKTSLEDSAALLASDDPPHIARHYLSNGSKAVIVTLGSAGVFTATGERSETIAGYKVEAVDATGAGDAFTGALLAELARGIDLFAAARFANAAAALSTLDYGAIKPLPRRADVDKFLTARSA